MEQYKISTFISVLTCLWDIYDNNNPKDYEHRHYWDMWEDFICKYGDSFSDVELLIVERETGIYLLKDNQTAESIITANKQSFKDFSMYIKRMCIHYGYKYTLAFLQENFEADNISEETFDRLIEEIKAYE